MALLYEKLQSTANSLINKYGSDIVLKKTITGSKVYDPVSDSYVGIDETLIVNTKCVYGSTINSDDESVNLTTIQKTATITYIPELDDFDATWTLNDNKIYRVDKTEVQNGLIVFTVYLG